MKSYVRNKKTGEIGELLGTDRAAGIINICIDFHDGKPKAYNYESLAELNEWWEDYKPKVPLIGDDEERELVSKWASAYCIQKVVARRTECMVIELADYDDKSRILAIDAYTTITDGIYTIEELCGEEEPKEYAEIITREYDHAEAVNRATENLCGEEKE